MSFQILGVVVCSETAFSMAAPAPSESASQNPQSPGYHAFQKRPCTCRVVSHTITRGVLVVSHTQSSAMIHSAHGRRSSTWGMTLRKVRGSSV